MDGHATKPIDARRLLASIAAHLQRAQTSAAMDRRTRGTSAPTSTLQVANFDRALERWMGNRALFARVRDQLILEAPKARASLADAVGREDVAAVHFFGHRLRGQAAAFDAEALIAALTPLESASSVGDWPAARAALARVDVEIERLSALLKGA
jgi:hypothetical protein